MLANGEGWSNDIRSWHPSRLQHYKQLLIGWIGWYEPLLPLDDNATRCHNDGAAYIHPQPHERLLSGWNDDDGGDRETGD